MRISKFGDATIAWFTMSREVGTNALSMTAEGANFEITMIDGSRDGIFKGIHEEVHDTSALYWEMTADNNLRNYNLPVYDSGTGELITPGDQGINPGTAGTISFYVTPKVPSVDLKFDFEIIGYHLLTNDNNTPADPTDDTSTLTPLADLSGSEGTVAQNLINGHILLFEHKDEKTVDGNTVITYTDPILSTADMHRVFSRTISGKTQIDIHWVWPNTLSTLVDARSFTGITTVPMCSGTSYTAVTTNIESYPQYYLKGVASGTTLDVDNDIIAHYDTYGDMYDQGDNEIGMRVHYILLKLSVTEGTAGGGGS